MTEKHAMTAAEAQTFDRVSLTSIITLQEAAEERGCSCQPYADWYTYRRWGAQGMQVQKGEHGVKLQTWITVQGDDDKTTRSYPKRTTVFCRCQVKPKNERTQ